jgi:transcriptional regulator with XRE-family HTH domain
MLVSMAELKENVKRLRLAAKPKKLTQQALAEKAGLSVSLIVQIERGAILDPRVSTVRALARALKTTLDALVGHKLLEAPEPVPVADGRQTAPAAEKPRKGHRRPRKGSSRGK